jgi:hypothetical protein
LDIENWAFVIEKRTKPLIPSFAPSDGEKVPARAVEGLPFVARNRIARAQLLFDFGVCFSA